MSIADSLMSESEFQNWVIDLAQDVHHYSVLFIPDSRRVGCAGWLDLVLAKPGRMIFAELKKQDGKLSPAQIWWIERHREMGDEVYVWRPSDRSEIERILP